MGVAMYKAVSQDGSDVSEKDDFARPPSQPTGWTKVVVVLALLLSASTAINGFFFWRRYVRPWELAPELRSRYAHLRRDVVTENLPSGKYDSVNRTIQDAAWDAPEMLPWNGFLALDDDLSVSLDLPHSQRWPWDLSKGVYIMTSSHELHCVRILRIYINENYDGVPESELTWGYPHILHCLNILRETVMCNADDTPLYVGKLHKNVGSDHPRAGIGSTRLCRNWDQLLDWSRAHSACYSPSVSNEIERYKYCPDGSRPWEGAAG